MLKNLKIGIIGLGYVGLPLSVAFATKYDVVGYDISQNRIQDILEGIDRTKEISENQLNLVKKSSSQNSIGLFPTSNSVDLAQCNVFIITVPTPIDRYNNPDLTPLVNATTTVSSYLKEGDIVIYESTVYPGVTEEEMVPLLEQGSGLKYIRDFNCGYSPERINPGDKTHTVTNILKITSGSTPEIANIIDNLYNSVISAGTFKAKSIKVAEAAKVIENSQRDINIAFVNELSKIFHLLDIDSNDVLEAASTKWNFLDFKPGLVGGHCIGVDPYYLAQKAQEIGYHPEIILAGRRLNDSMGKYVAGQTLKFMMKKNLKIIGSKVLILGFTFKENCPDFRNTGVIDIYRELKIFDINVDIHDPWVDPEPVKYEYDIDIIDFIPSQDVKKYSAIILAVAHKQFLSLEITKSDKLVIFDVKGILSKENVDGRL